MDVAQLYPSVPRGEGLAACRRALETRTVGNIPTEELIEVNELVLDNNNFQLGENRNYIQTDGTAIGSKLGRDFACTYMGAWEQELLSRAAPFATEVVSFYRRHMGNMVTWGRDLASI